MCKNLFTSTRTIKNGTSGTAGFVRRVLYTITNMLLLELPEANICTVGTTPIDRTVAKCDKAMLQRDRNGE